MKAITVWEPWAALWAYRIKLYETRGCATSYRGPIAIHAAKRDPHALMLKLPRHIASAIYDCLYAYFGIQGGALKRLPTGCIIATADLVDCHRIGIDPKTHRVALYSSHGYQSSVSNCANELLFGDWTPGRYAWEVDNVKLLDEPVPARGQQGLWEWSESHDR